MNTCDFRHWEAVVKRSKLDKQEVDAVLWTSHSWKSIGFQRTDSELILHLQEQSERKESGLMFGDSVLGLLKKKKEKEKKKEKKKSFPK